MKKVARSRILLDRLHKGFVVGCIGITLYGFGHFGLRWYRYFAVLRPEAKEKERLDKQTLLLEGRAHVELVKDNAASIS